MLLEWLLGEGFALLLGRGQAFLEVKGLTRKGNKRLVLAGAECARAL